MWKRLLALVAATALALPPSLAAQQREEEVTPAEMCENICAELAAQNCERINSISCTFYIVGCLAGCSVGALVALAVD